ncbi:MAG: NAD-dependent epimerase/dehydratase family protein [Prevotellaceae bacterium]|jgi:nucleoside-diphosphate-sugar epimerase|nr:NAD-dependent epimerase/dehydratase family protein [Prevotellaceae bacterium]
MKVLVTGANGLLGHHVVNELLRRKHDVNVIVRNSSNIFFETDKVNLFIGNFCDENDLSTSAEGCDAMIHIAGITDMNLLSLDDYEKVNVRGSSTILKVAGKFAIKTILFISTANTVGYQSPSGFSDENNPIQSPFCDSFYAQSKLSAEKLFFEASQQPGMHVIVLNPGFILGGFDTKPSSGKMVLMAYKKQVMIAPSGGKNIVDAECASFAICNALTQGRNGEKYLITGQNILFRAFYRLQKTIGNYRQIIVPVPDFVLLIIGGIGDLMGFFGIKNDIRTRNLRQLMIEEYYTNTKAKKELGMQDTDIEKTLTKTIAWFKKRNLIK